jgi:hypothetical protein
MLRVATVISALVGATESNWGNRVYTEYVCPFDYNYSESVGRCIEKSYCRPGKHWSKTHFNCLDNCRYDQVWIPHSNAHGGKCIINPILFKTISRDAMWASGPEIAQARRARMTSH